MMTYQLTNVYPFKTEERQLLNWMFIFHTAVCFASVSIFFNGGDAKDYWMFPKKVPFEYIWEMVLQKLRPTQIMYLICYFPSNILGLTFFSGMLMFSLFGFWGFILILQVVKTFFGDLMSLRQFTILGIPIFPYIFLLPNMHFWSVAIGKDSLLFFSVCAFIYGLLNIRKRWFLILLGVLIAYYLRPHVLLFFAAAYGASFILSGRLNLFQKIFFGAIGLALFFPLLNNVLDFAQIDEFSTEHLDDFASSKSTVLSKAGSGIDFSNYPYVLKVLTFVFRPFFFDINGIPAIIASIENLVQAFLFYFFFKNKSWKFIFKANILVRTCFFYFIIGALAFAPVMSNLGIIIREKNMLMPAFLIFILASVKYKQLMIQNGGNI